MSSNRRKRQQQHHPMAADGECHHLSKLISGIVLLSAISSVAAAASASSTRDELLNNEQPQQQSDILTRELRRDPLYPTYSPTAPWPTWAPTAGEEDEDEDEGNSPPVIDRRSIPDTADTAPPSPAPQVPTDPPSDVVIITDAPTDKPIYVSPPAYNTPPAQYEVPPSYGSPPVSVYSNTPPSYGRKDHQVYSRSGYYANSHQGYNNQQSSSWYHGTGKTRRYSNGSWNWNGSSWSWSWNNNSGYSGYSSSKAGKGSKVGEYNQWWNNGWKNPANQWQQHGYQWSVSRYGKSGKGRRYGQQGSRWSNSSPWSSHTTTHFEGLDIHGSKWQTRPDRSRSSWGWVVQGKAAKAAAAGWGSGWGNGRSRGWNGWGSGWSEWGWGGKHYPIYPPPTEPPISTPRPSNTSKPPSIPTTAAPSQADPTKTAKPTSSPPTYYPTYNPTPAVTSPPVTASPTRAPSTPTVKPTSISTESPSSISTESPTSHPSAFPSIAQTSSPTATNSPTGTPTNFTTSMPSSMPTPFFNGTASPTASPSDMPTVFVFPELQQILFPEAASENSFFGSSVAVDGNTLAVGVQGDDLGIGSVRVYVTNNNNDFEFQSLLKPNDGTPNDDFGRAVAMSGNFIIVGSQRHDAEGENSGAAYIYERSLNDDGRVGWSQVAKLTPPEPEADERFGISVSIQGNVAIVGANGNDSNGENAGAAYLFTLGPNIIGIDEWKFTKKLVAPDGAPGDNFGFSVSIYGNQAVVGAVWANERGGSAYVFIKQGENWTTQGKFEGENPNDQFGWSVSIYEETIAVGAIKFDDRTTGPLTREVSDRGSVNIYVKDTNGSWFREARLEPSDGKEGDHFGRSLDLYDDRLIVSAPFNDEMGVDAGTAYIYQREDDWLLQAKVLPTEEAALSEFGFSVGVSSKNFVVSSKYFNQETDLLGNAYIYNTRNPNDPTPSPTTSTPTRSPTSRPTSKPTIALTPPPTQAPTTAAPTELLSQSPSTAPSQVPTVLATTMKPSQSPSTATTPQPSEVPSSAPSEKASTESTSSAPSGQPSGGQPLPIIPTYPPTIFGGESPSSKPSIDGTKMPTYSPTPGPPGASSAPSAATNSTAAPSAATNSTAAPSVGTNSTSTAAPSVGTNSTSTAAPSVGTNSTSTASPSASTNGTAAPTPFGDFTESLTESPVASNETRMPTYSPTPATPA